MINPKQLAQAAAHQADAFVSALKGQRDILWLPNAFPPLTRLLDEREECIAARKIRTKAAAQEAQNKNVQAHAKPIDANANATKTAIFPISPKEQSLVQGLLLYAQAASAEPRIHQALQSELVKIKLSDGSELSLDDAEKALRLKEEKSAFAPLAQRLAKATSLHTEPAAFFYETCEEFNLQNDDPALILGGNLALAEQTLKRFLSETHEAHLAAFQVLQSTSKDDLDTPFALSRALNLPNTKGHYSQDAVQKLCAATLHAASAHLLRPIKRMNAPRKLAGLSLSAAKTIRIAWCPAARSERFSALLSASGAGVGLSLLGDESLFAEDAGRLLGVGFSFAWQHAPLSRKILDIEKNAALLNQQHLLAQKVVFARMAATAALSVLHTGRSHKALRENLSQLLDQDAGNATVSAFLNPPWPGQKQQRGLIAELGSAALGAGIGAALDVALRERFDEFWPLMPPVFDWINSVRAPLTEGAVPLASLLELEGTPGQALSKSLLGLL